MGLFKTLKVNAKRSLSGAWGRAIGIMLLAILPSILINALEYGIRAVAGIPEFMDLSSTPSVAFDDKANVMLVSTIISILITLLIFVVVTPLSQGVVRWFYRRTGGENDGVTELFYYFETARDYFKSLGLYFIITLRMILWMILLCIPACVGGAVIYAMGLSGAEIPNTVSTISSILAIVWFIIVTILFMLISMRYFLAPYLLAEHPEMKVRQAIKQGIKMVRGHKGRLFLFNLSFILWWLPTVLGLLLIIPVAFSGMTYMMAFLGLFIVLMIIQFGLFFYVIPYMNAAFAMYARYLIQLNEGGTDEIYVDTTREYEYKAEIDRYMEEQTLRKNDSENEQ
ncbi:DUF975 family protein [Oscillospiraceae bacterium PP1C4]